MDAETAFDAGRFLTQQGLLPRVEQSERLRDQGWNQVTRLRGGGRDLVVKRYHPRRGPARFPSIPAAEAAALKHLAASGVVPRLRGFFDREEPPLLVYDFLPGRLQAGRPEALGRALGALHALTLPEDPHPFRRLPYRAAAIRQEGERLFAQHPALAESPRGQALLACKPPDEALPRPPRLAVVHGLAGDCLLEMADGSLSLLGWQGCGAGDPAEDLFACLSPAMQHLAQRPPTHSAERARLFVAHGDAGAEARLQRLWPHYAWRLLAHCAAQHLLLAESDPAAAARHARAFDLEFAYSVQSRGGV